MNNDKDHILRFADWVFKNPLLSVLYIVIISIVMIGVAQLPYSIGSSGGIIVDFGAGDLLTFFGAVFTAIATVFLGVIAYIQNNNLNKVNNDLMRIQNESLIPIIDVSNVKVTSSRVPTKKLAGNDKEFNLYNSKKENQEYPQIGCKLKLENGEVITEVSTIVITLQCITSNIIKKLSLMNLETKLIEVAEVSNTRKYDTTKFMHLNSTKRFLQKGDVIELEVEIQSDGTEQSARLLSKYGEISLIFELESLSTKYCEVIKVSIFGHQLHNIEYQFDCYENESVDSDA